MKETRVTPEPLLQLQFSMAPARVLVVGTQLEVFTHISQGKTTAPEIARAAAADPRALRMLLDTLCAFQLLSKHGERYELTPVSATFLVKHQPDYMGQMLEADRMWSSWTHLAEVVKTGKPLERVEEQKGAEAFFPILIRSLHVTNREPARRLAQALGGRRVLDIACGSGVWGITFAEAHGEARVTANDFPAVLGITREYVRRHGLEARFDFLPGDLKTTDYGSGRFDLAILGNIVHSEGERSSRALFRKLHRALEPGGRIAIVDMIPNEERTGPPFPVLFALNMLLHTQEGDCYTFDEYRRWLEEAGFERVERVDVGSHSPLVVGVNGKEGARGISDPL